MKTKWKGKNIDKLLMMVRWCSYGAERSYTQNHISKGRRRIGRETSRREKSFSINWEMTMTWTRSGLAGQYFSTFLLLWIRSISSLLCILFSAGKYRSSSISRLLWWAGGKPLKAIDIDWEDGNWLNVVLIKLIELLHISLLGGRAAQCLLVECWELRRATRYEVKVEENL